MADGSSRDVTIAARWDTEWLPPLGLGPPVSIDGPGLVTGRQAGQTQILVSFQAHARSTIALVLPHGTHKLGGHVSDEGGGTSVSDVLVDVVSGAGAGMSTRTNYFGSYWLFGVAGDTELRFSKGGYRELKRRVALMNDQVLQVSLVPSQPHANVAGIYTVRIASASECGRGLRSQPLPEEAAVRTYTASIDQSGSLLRMALESPDMQRITVEGRMEAGRVTFLIPGPSHADEAPQFIDRISASSSLTVDGTVWTSSTGPRMEGELAGALRVFDGGREIASCGSLNHQFTMWR